MEVFFFSFYLYVIFALIKDDIMARLGWFGDPSLLCGAYCICDEKLNKNSVWSLHTIYTKVFSTFLYHICWLQQDMSIRVNKSKKKHHFFPMKSEFNVIFWAHAFNSTSVRPQMNKNLLLKYAKMGHGVRHWWLNPMMEYVLNNVGSLWTQCDETDLLQSKRTLPSS